MVPKPEKSLQVIFSGSNMPPICVRIHPGMSASDVIASYLPRLKGGKYHFLLESKNDFVSRDADLWPLVPPQGDVLRIMPGMTVAI